MISVYDALQRARQGGRDLTLPGEQPVAPLSPDWRPVTPAPGPIAAELAPLLAVVRPLLDGGKGAVVHFVAAAPGEGTSTIAREFAMLAATTGQRRTLLLDAVRDNPQTARHF